MGELMAKNNGKIEVIKEVALFGECAKKHPVEGVFECNRWLERYVPTVCELVSFCCFPRTSNLFNWLFSALLFFLLLSQRYQVSPACRNTLHLVRRPYLRGLETLLPKSVLLVQAATVTQSALKHKPCASVGF
jgi:hypothetical protein